MTQLLERPNKQLEAIFVAVAHQATSPNCLGCAFMHAAEFPDQNHAGHATALAYKKGVLAKLEELSVAIGAREPKALAADLMLVMDGAWAAARMFGAVNHAARVGYTARVLIEAQL
jgi:hypothetical protein